jgi:hypothetical protein
VLTTIDNLAGSAVNMAKDIVVVGADNNGECTLGSNQCNVVSVASVTGCNSNGVFTCASENDCWFRVGAKLYFEKDGPNNIFCGVAIGTTYFVLQSNGLTFTVSACAKLSTSENPPTKKACSEEGNQFTPGAVTLNGFMLARSHSGEGAAFVFERNLPHVTDPSVYASMFTNPPPATFATQNCVPQYVSVVVVSSLNDVFTISTKPETYGCKYCITTTADFAVGRAVYFSAVNFFGGVSAVAEGQPVFAGNFIVGMVYQIVTVGSQPFFTNIGANDNNIGTVFMATGTGAADMGTGSAILQPYKIHSKPTSVTFSIRKLGNAMADLSDSVGTTNFMTASTSIEVCVPVKNVWGFRRQLMAPEENLQYLPTNIPINKQGDRFGCDNCVVLRPCEKSNSLNFAGASVWVDEDLSASSPNNPVIIVGAPMKKQDNPTEFVITAIKSEHITYYRPSLEPELRFYKFKHVFMCNDCQVYEGDRVVFTGIKPDCVPDESGELGGRTGILLNRIYYVAGVVRKYSPSGTFLPEGFQIAYSHFGAEVNHPNELFGPSGNGEDVIVNSENTGIVTVGTCGDKQALWSTKPNGNDPLPEYTYDQGSGPLQGPKALGCECSTGNQLKMKIVRVNAAGGAYIWEKSGGVWMFKSRLSIPGPFTPLASNVLWAKSYFGMFDSFGMCLSNSI